MTLKFNPFTNKLDITGTSGSGSGDVSGPGSSTDNAIVRWDGTSGTLIQNSVATLSDTGDILANSIDLTVPVDETDGGTGQSAYTTGDILYASGVNTLTVLPIGSATQVLTVTGGLPSWQPSSGGGGGVTSVNGTAGRITSTGGATPVIDIDAAYVGQASITTLGTISTGTWNGSTIDVAHGGTGRTTLTNHGVLVGAAAGAITQLATGSAGQVLQSAGAAADPTYSTATYPSTTTISQILYSSSNNVVAGLATANRAVLTTNSTGVPVLTALTDGQIIIGSTAGAPAAASLTAGSNITITPGSNTITIAATGGGASPLTTKGDIFTFSTVDARLPVGANGTILTADSTATTGNKWTTATFPSTATGTGKVLIADGTNWVASTPTFPNASATSGKFIQSDGTNWVASTPTLPTTAGAAGKILRSDGTNYVESTPTYPNSATSTGTILRADGTNWVASTATYPNTATTGDLIYGSASNTYSNLSIPTNTGVPLSYNGTNVVWYDPTKVSYYHDDFITGNNLSLLGWNSSTSGTGAAVNLNNTTNFTSGKIGLINMLTGTDTTGRAGVITDATNFVLDSAIDYMDLMFSGKVSALSDGTDTYTLRLGYGETNGAAAVDGMYFEYTNGVNSGNWQIVTASNSTRTTNNTSTAATTNWTVYRIKATSTSINFYIDGSEVANSPISTNIPTGTSRTFGFKFEIVKSAGTTQRVFSLDWVSHYKKLV